MKHDLKHFGHLHEKLWAVCVWSFVGHGKEVGLLMFELEVLIYTSEEQNVTH